VPGPVDEPRSAGCLAFYREYREVVGIVTGIPELLLDLGLDGDGRRTGGAAAAADTGAPSVAALLIELGGTARQVADALVAGHGSIDELVQATGHEPATVLGAITLLEMRGLASSTYGRYRAAGRLASAAPSAASSGRTLRRAPRCIHSDARDRPRPSLPGRSRPC
jgi:hypothetical protein